MTVDFRIPELETERLRLRLPTASDVAAHRAFHASHRSKTVGGPFDATESYQHLATLVGQWQLRGYGRWMVADKESDAPLGIVGLFHPHDWPEPEIAWTVYENGEGKGIAMEAALAVRAFVYDTLGWTRIVSMISDDNTRSMALARRLGCHQDGVFNHPTYGNLYIWVHPRPEDRK